VLLGEDLVPVIARHLAEVGEYRTTLDARDAQQLVDVRWAALRLSRQVGRKLRVIASRATETRDAPVTVRVTYAETGRRSIPRQRHPD
jgi:hypothetical protein